MSCLTLCDLTDCSMPGLPVLHHLLEFALICVSWVSVAIQTSHPLSSPSPLTFILSQHQGLFQWVRLFASGGQSSGFSFSISPSNEYSGLISFTIDWFNFLAVKETLKSLLRHHNSKASLLQCSVFFMVQLSHPYMTTGKTTALTRQTFVGKVTSLYFNMLSRFIIAFLPRSKKIWQPVE